MAGTPQHVTLTPSTVATLTFDVDFAKIEVLNVDGAGEVYVTVDGTTPAVGATGSLVLPAAIGSVEIEPRHTGETHSGNTVVKLISSSAVKVSVRGL